MNCYDIPKSELEKDVNNKSTHAIMAKKYKVSFSVIKRLCAKYELCPIKGRQGGHNIKDMTGKKFGSLIVEEYDSKSKGKLASWICKCVCENTCSALGTDLRRGKIKTCGCRKGIKSRRNFQGYGKISKSKWRVLVQNAEQRNIPFDISIEQIDDLFKKQNYKCRFTGLPLEIKGNKGNASLDRIDSYKGYTIDNIQWVHKKINKLKGQFSDKEFLTLCEMIAEHNNDKQIRTFI